MTSKEDLLDAAEVATRATISSWIRKALRECFFQGLKQSWKVLPVEPAAGKSPEESEKEDFRVELSLSGINACLSFVDRLSQAWQRKLREEGHERVSQWVAEIYCQGKSTLWAEPTKEHDNSRQNKEGSQWRGDLDIQATHQETEQDEAAESSFIDLDSLTTEPYACSTTQLHHPNPYSKLRSLGRKRKVDYSVLSVSDAIDEIQEFTQNHPTYWPLDHDVIDQASLEMADRMRLKDRHGVSTTRTTRNEEKSATTKRVHFQVLPKTARNDGSKKVKLTETGSYEESNSDALQEPKSKQDERTRAASLLLASRKRNNKTSRQSKKNTSLVSRINTAMEDTPRPPYDISTSYEGSLPIELTMDERKKLDRLLILDESEPMVEASIPPKMTLGLFGGLQHVGQANHAIKNNTTNDVGFKATNKVIRRKERISVQERLDPNKVQVGRAENPEDRNSKVLRTEDWFDDRKKFLEFDLGWSLLEIPTSNLQKRLCAFASIEGCLKDKEE